MTNREMSPETRTLIRDAVQAEVTRALHEDLPPEAETRAIVNALVPIIASIDENAHKRGEAHGYLAALQEVLLERTDEEEPFIAELRDAAIRRMEAIQ